MTTMTTMTNRVASEVLTATKTVLGLRQRAASDESRPVNVTTMSRLISGHYPWRHAQPLPAWQA